jgi:peroxiredoxin
MPNKISELATAPDFELLDTQGKTVHLAEIYAQKPVVLVLMRGFV